MAFSAPAVQQQAARMSTRYPIAAESSSNFRNSAACPSSLCCLTPSCDGLDRLTVSSKYVNHETCTLQMQQYEDKLSRNASASECPTFGTKRLRNRCRISGFPVTAELAFTPTNETESTQNLVPVSDSESPLRHEGSLQSNPFGLSSVKPGFVRFEKGIGMLNFSQISQEYAVRDSSLGSPDTESPAAIPTFRDSTLSKPTIGSNEVSSPGPGLLTFRNGVGSVVFRGEMTKTAKQLSVAELISAGFERLKEIQRHVSWLCGPLALVVATIAPPALLLPLFANIMGSTKTSELLALVGTDISFLVAVCFFLYWTHTRGLHLNTSVGESPWDAPWRESQFPGGYLEWRNALWLLGVCFPLGVSLLSTQVFIGVLAAAVLLPPVIMFLVQAFLEKLGSSHRSPAAPLIALLFDGYRLHQLNRAAVILSSAFKALQVNPESNEVLMAASGLHWVYVTVQMLGGLWLCNASINLFCLPWLFSSWRSKEAQGVPA